jgi:polyhydroxyalkanoate synthesis regulator phasin
MDNENERQIRARAIQQSINDMMSMLSSTLAAQSGEIAVLNAKIESLQKQLAASAAFEKE